MAVRDACRALLGRDATKARPRVPLPPAFHRAAPRGPPSLRARACVPHIQTGAPFLRFSVRVPPVRALRLAMSKLHKGAITRARVALRQTKNNNRRRAQRNVTVFPFRLTDSIRPVVGRPGERHDKQRERQQENKESVRVRQRERQRERDGTSGTGTANERRTARGRRLQRANTEVCGGCGANRRARRDE